MSDGEASLGAGEFSDGSASVYDQQSPQASSARSSPGQELNTPVRAPYRHSSPPGTTMLQTAPVVTVEDTNEVSILDNDVQEARINPHADEAILPGPLKPDEITPETIIFAPPSAIMNLSSETAEGIILCSIVFHGKSYGSFSAVAHEKLSFKILFMSQVPHFKSFLSHCSTSHLGSETSSFGRKDLFALVRTALRKPGFEAIPLTMTTSKDPQFATSSELQAANIFQKEAAKVIEAYKGNFQKPLQPPPIKPIKHKTVVKGKGSFSDYLEAPELEVGRMFTHDNISLFLTNPPSKVLSEELKAREHLARTANLLELFHQTEQFLAAAGNSASPHHTPSAISCFLPYFQLARPSFEQEVAHWSAEAARKKMEARFAATTPIKHANLKVGFMSAPLDCPDLVSPKAAQEQVKAIKDIPADMRAKLVTSEGYSSTATFRKHTKPSPVGVPPKPQGSTKKQGYASTSKSFQQPPHRPYPNKATTSSSYKNTTKRYQHTGYKGPSKSSPNKDPRRRDTNADKQPKRHRTYQR